MPIEGGAAAALVRVRPSADRSRDRSVGARPAPAISAWAPAAADDSRKSAGRHVLGAQRGPEAGCVQQAFAAAQRQDGLAMAELVPDELEDVRVGARAPRRRPRRRARTSASNRKPGSFSSETSACDRDAVRRRHRADARARRSAARRPARTARRGRRLTRLPDDAVGHEDHHLAAGDRAVAWTRQQRQRRRHSALRASAARARASGIGSGNGMFRPCATFAARSSEALRSDASMRVRMAGTVTLLSSKRNAAAMCACSAGDWLSKNRRAWL